MQGQRAGMLAAFAALVAFAGCNSSPSTTPAPAAPAPAPVVATSVANPTLETLQTDDDNKKSEVRIGGLAPGSVVTWTSAAAFYVQFDSAKLNPCDPKGTGVSSISPFTYNSTTSSPYTATCTIVAPPSGKRAYRYNVYPGQLPPATLRIQTNSHCEGCVIDMSGN